MSVHGKRWRQDTGGHGQRRTPGAKHSKQGSDDATVTLHVYDLHRGLVGLNGLLRQVGMAAFHAGVQVYGVEYSFSGRIEEDENCPDNPCGIFCHVPRDHGVHVYRESFVLGRTSLSQGQVEALLDRVSPVWPAGSYHLLRRNCCHFAEYFTRCLGVPSCPPALASLSRKMAAVADMVGTVRTNVFGPPAMAQEETWEARQQEIAAACASIEEEEESDVEDECSINELPQCLHFMPSPSRGPGMARISPCRSSFHCQVVPVVQHCQPAIIRQPQLMRCLTF